MNNTKISVGDNITLKWCSDGLFTGTTYSLNIFAKIYISHHFEELKNVKLINQSILQRHVTREKITLGIPLWKNINDNQNNSEGNPSFMRIGIREFIIAPHKRIVILDTNTPFYYSSLHDSSNTRDLIMLNTPDITFLNDINSRSETTIELVDKTASFSL
jgi:hypothetical protein